MTDTTYGDTSLVDCPACGGQIRDLWDYGEEVLRAAPVEIECPHCELKVMLVSVETVHEVRLDTIEVKE